MSTPRSGLRTAIANRLAALARRVAPQTLADHGYALPAHLTAASPTNSVMRDLRVAAGKANAAALGIPDTALMNQMLANQAPQAEPVALYAPGAPLLPTPGMETPYGPRQQDYDIGINVAALPRSTEATSFQQLRNLAALYEGIALCKRVWFDTINRLDVKVTFLPGTIPDGQSEKDPKWQKITQPALEFLKYPDRERTIHDWMIASVEDVLDLGQSPIYINRNRKGEIISLDIIDAATIKPLFDQRGRLPKPPYPAFEQFIKGVPAGLYNNQPVMPDEIKAYTASSFMLIREMARTSSIYSRSRVEDIIFRVNQALRKENLDLARYTDGAVPDGMLFMDDSVAWSQDESEELERQLNNLLGGNDRRKVHLKVIPPGVKSYQSTRPEDPQMDFDRWLLNITVACFGLTMDELGFTDTSNRSVGQSQENVIYRRVVQPLARRYGDFLTWVVQQRFDPRLQVTWGGIAETEDLMQKVNLLRVGVEVGAISPTYLAREMGWGVETEVPAYITPQGGAASIVVVEDIPQLREMNLQNAATSQQQQQAALKISQSQGTELDNQIAQQKQQAENPFGMFGGGENGPENGETPSDEGESDQGTSGSSADENTPPPSGETDKGSSGSTSQQSDEDDEGDAAEAQVDHLVNQAKTKGNGKQQRDQVADLPAQLEELRRYRVVVTKALKRGKVVPAFESAILPGDLHNRLAADLVPCRTVEAIQPFFAQARLELLQIASPDLSRITQPDHEHQFVEQRCMVCGCGQPYNDHALPFEVLPPQTTENTSCMVAFFLPGQAAQTLALPGGERPRDLHITLAYLGPAADVDCDHLCETVKAFGSITAPIQVDLDTLTTFPGNEDCGTPLIIRTETPALHDLRARLVAALDVAGIPVDRTFPDYKPHCTLAYLPYGSDIPDITVPDIHPVLSQIWVAYGDARYAFPLGPDATSRAVLSTLRALKGQVDKALEA